MMSEYYLKIAADHFFEQKKLSGPDEYRATLEMLSELDFNPDLVLAAQSLEQVRAREKQDDFHDAQEGDWK